MTLTPERTCGTCKLCCTVMSVVEIGKPGNVKCGQLDCKSKRHGCRIYSWRPISCADYQCTWLRGAWGDEMRPDRCKCVMGVEGTTDGPVLCVYESAPGAAQTDQIREAVDSLVVLLAVENLAISIIAPSGDRILLTTEWNLLEELPPHFMFSLDPNAAPDMFRPMLRKFAGSHRAEGGPQRVW